MLPFQPTLLPIHFGWILENDSYKIKWFEGDVAPRILDIVCSQDERTHNENDEGK